MVLGDIGCGLIECEGEVSEFFCEFCCSVFVFCVCAVAFGGLEEELEGLLFSQFVHFERFLDSELSKGTGAGGKEDMASCTRRKEVLEELGRVGVVEDEEVGPRGLASPLVGKRSCRSRH